MRMNLTLVDVTIFGIEDVFDGVFQGKDVIFSILVDEIDERGQGS